jgi:hypothetical protein
MKKFTQTWLIDTDEKVLEHVSNLVPPGDFYEAVSHIFWVTGDTKGTLYLTKHEGQYIWLATDDKDVVAYTEYYIVDAQRSLT